MDTKDARRQLPHGGIASWSWRRVKVLTNGGRDTRSVNTFPFRLLIHFRRDWALIFKHPAAVDEWNCGAPQQQQIPSHYSQLVCCKLATLWCFKNYFIFYIPHSSCSGKRSRTFDGKGGYRTLALDLWPGARQSVCGSVRALKANSAAFVYRPSHLGCKLRFSPLLAEQEKRKNCTHKVEEWCKLGRVTRESK